MRIARRQAFLPRFRVAEGFSGKVLGTKVLCPRNSGTPPHRPCASVFLRCAPRSTATASILAVRLASTPSILLLKRSLRAFISTAVCSCLEFDFSRTRGSPGAAPRAPPAPGQAWRGYPPAEFPDAPFPPSFPHFRSIFENPTRPILRRHSGPLKKPLLCGQERFEQAPKLHRESCRLSGLSLRRSAQRLHQFNISNALDLHDSTAVLANISSASWGKRVRITSPAKPARNLDLSSARVRSMPISS